MILIQFLGKNLESFSVARQAPAFVLMANSLYLIFSKKEMSLFVAFIQSFYIFD